MQKDVGITLIKKSHIKISPQIFYHHDRLNSLGPWGSEEEAFAPLWQLFKT